MDSGEHVADGVGAAIILPEESIDVGHDTTMGFRLIIFVWEAVSGQMVYDKGNMTFPASKKHSIHTGRPHE
jgi:hypothetical protein